MHRHRNVAKVSRRQRGEILLPDAELSTTRVYLLHDYRLAAVLTDSLHSLNVEDIQMYLLYPMLCRSG